MNKPVYHPSQLSGVQFDKILIASSFVSEINQTLASYGIEPGIPVVACDEILQTSREYENALQAVHSKREDMLPKIPLLQQHIEGTTLLTDRLALLEKLPTQGVVAELGPVPSPGRQGGAGGEQGGGRDGERDGRDGGGERGAAASWNGSGHVRSSSRSVRRGPGRSPDDASDAPHSLCGNHRNHGRALEEVHSASGPVPGAAPTAASSTASSRARSACPRSANSRCRRAYSARPAGSSIRTAA